VHGPPEHPIVRQRLDARARRTPLDEQRFRWPVCHEQPVRFLAVPTPKRVGLKRVGLVLFSTGRREFEDCVNTRLSPGLNQVPTNWQRLTEHQVRASGNASQSLRKIVEELAPGHTEPSRDDLRILLWHEHVSLSLVLTH
jgi:hypothetical protein